ncbi:FAD-dependent oxidoreductase domain-containing protein 1 [Branchiostoma belcheri]|nr:FAD-dependent oxidoreductase domain-containing protein 1 [Branchiostoma belcheri]
MKIFDEGWDKAKQRMKTAITPGPGFTAGWDNPNMPINNYDIVIIGGGVMGWSTAYWLMRKVPRKARGKIGLNVLVVEKDPSYTRASTVLSVGSIRQQFTLPENINMSMFSSHFIRNIREYLSVYEEDPPDVQFNPQGYLFLATSEGAEQLKQAHDTQIALGAKVRLFTKRQLEVKFPWLNTEGIELGNYGMENEGWFDPWLLLMALKKKAISLGVNHCHGEVTDLIVDAKPGMIEGRLCKKISHVKVKMINSIQYQNVQAGHYINTAGPWAQDIARMIGIGQEDPMGLDWELQAPLPVEPRKRYVYVYHCPRGPGLDCPMVVDPSGTYFRREGLAGNYLCGKSPEEHEEPDANHLEVDYNYFNETIWPILAHRVQAFEELKLRMAWAGYYDYNTVDQNAIIGTHPIYDNLYFANGFSGHGIQQAPAVGRAVAELLLDGDFKTIDLRRFGFERFLRNEPIREKNIV